MTDNAYDNIDDLLVKVLLGEASEEERGQVERWVSLSPANQHHLADFSKIWEESRRLAVRSTVNEDDAWNNFQRRVGADAHRPLGESFAVNRSVVSSMPIRTWSWLQVAAVFMVIVIGSWLYYNYGYRPEQFISRHTADGVYTDTLPEGTIVTLNKQSAIRYRRQLAGDTRTVELEGEAFFDVTPDKNKPFMVYAKGVLIKVIGTSFNVKTTGDTTEVIVETGRVEITSNRQTISLGMHEKALVGGKYTVPVKQPNKDELYNYYRTHEFECNGLPLGRLVEKLNEVYKVHVMIGNSRLRDLPLTTTFRDESLDEILNVVTRTLKISMVRNGEEIILQ